MCVKGVLTCLIFQDGFTLPAEERLAYLTGFTGSDGVAVVTTGQQALWTDGRYYLQAEDELDCDWILMKDGLEGVREGIFYQAVLIGYFHKVANTLVLGNDLKWEGYVKKSIEISLSRNPRREQRGKEGSEGIGEGVEVKWSEAQTEFGKKYKAKKSSEGIENRGEEGGAEFGQEGERIRR